MKKLSLLFFIFFTVGARAQWVSIPDTNFGTWLNLHGYNFCLQGDNQAGWQLDTSCPAVVNATTLYCDYQNIQSITGIQYFDSLKSLTCNGNTLTNIPALPNGLTSLSCEYNLLTSLPVLPNGLTTLRCDHNQLIALPDLPNGLSTLHCRNNQLIALPALPAVLFFFVLQR